MAAYLPPLGFMGNGGDNQFSNVVKLASELREFVEVEVQKRYLVRGVFPILRPAHYHILVDAESIHIVYTNTGAGALPFFNVTDLTAGEQSPVLTGMDAIMLVEGQLGYADCQAISIPKSLLDAPEENRIKVLRDEALDYVMQVKAMLDEKLADEEARRLLNLPVAEIATSLSGGIKAALKDVPFDRSVFVMMRYRESEHFLQIEEAIITTLKAFGLQARLAKDKAYSDDLWDNVRIYMHASKYGLAVFEEIDERHFNPNVAMEVGYMYALGRRILLLKDKRMPAMPTDILGQIYKPFDSYKIAQTIKDQIKDWVVKDLSMSA
jgi:hypothetical protein